MAKRDTPACPHARACGACQHIGEAYEGQLAEKDAFVASLFDEKLFAKAQIRPILGMEAPFHYRNKVMSPFAPDKRRSRSKHLGTPARGKGAGAARDILTGMYAKGTHRLVRTDGCLVENKQGQQVIAAVRSLMMRHGIAPYDEDTGQGFVRHVIVRVGHESSEVLVTIVTNDDEFPSSKSFCRQLLKRCPFITSIVQNVNTRRTNVVLGNKERRLYGPGFILDTLCSLSFRISSQSFYQVNSSQTTVLYETAMQLANLGSPDCSSGAVGAEGPMVIDAYCGTGTIGLVAASRGAMSVIGVDSVESAIRDARENARHNGLENAHFYVGDAGAFMAEAAEAGKRFDIAFMDPPRSGAGERFLQALAQAAPKRIVYISCNPKTQVRDALLLANAGYELKVVQPVDMFPHTDHVECVALLSKAN